MTKYKEVIHIYIS